MLKTKIPVKAIKSLKKAGKKLNLTKNELSGCKLALTEMAKKSQ